MLAEDRHLAEHTRRALAEVDDDPFDRRRGLDRQATGRDQQGSWYYSHPTQRPPPPRRCSVSHRRGSVMSAHDRMFRY